MTPRVLVVDEEPGVLVFMRSVLTSAGKRVVAAESPDDAMAAIAADPFDLVVADMRMPGNRSGLELLDELNELYPSVPVLLIAGVVDNEALTAALDHGAAGFLAKPFTPEQLCAKVDRVLTRKSSSEAEVRARLVAPTIATALANAIEVKDADMDDHVETAGGDRLLIGHRLRLHRHDMEMLELGAVLHDVGKIGIPDSILMKPGELDPEEREVMKAHTVIGDQMLRHLHLDEVRPVVRHHHEFWDGSGYPDKLSGEEIPRLARIVAVADAITAMSAHRPYRQPLSRAQIRNELLRGKRSQWEPALADLVLELIDDGTVSFGPEGSYVQEEAVPARRPSVSSAFVWTSGHGHAA